MQPQFPAAGQLQVALSWLFAPSCLRAPPSLVRYRRLERGSRMRIPCYSVTAVTAADVPPLIDCLGSRSSCYFDATSFPFFSPLSHLPLSGLSPSQPRATYETRHDSGGSQAIPSMSVQFTRTQTRTVAEQVHACCSAIPIHHSTHTPQSSRG